MTRRLMGMERLEDRTLLAGNVIVWMSSGSLTVRGDAQDNDIDVEQIDDQTWEVSGYGGTLINGCPAPKRFTGFNLTRGNVSIDMQGGDDVVHVYVRGNGIPGDLRIDLGPAAGSRSQQAVVDGRGQQAPRIGKELRINGSAENDDIDLFRLQVQDAVNIAVGHGDNTVKMQNIEVGGALSIVAGDGEDTIDLDRVDVRRALDIAAGHGNNRVQLDRVQVVGELKITAGDVNSADMDSSDGDSTDGDSTDRDNQLLLRDVVAQDNLTIYAGRGNDEVRLRDVRVEKLLTVKPGQGNDAVTLQGVQVGGERIYIQTRTGNNVVHLHDVRNLTGKTVDLKVTLGDGNDRLYASNVNLERRSTFTVRMGEGNDTAKVWDCTAHTAKLFGKEGYDTLYLGVNNFNELRLAGWEEIYFFVDGVFPPSYWEPDAVDQAFLDPVTTSTDAERSVDELVGDVQELKAVRSPDDQVLDDLLPALLALPF
jgi:hypothetical protein